VRATLHAQTFRFGLRNIGIVASVTPLHPPGKSAAGATEHRDWARPKVRRHRRSVIAKQQSPPKLPRPLSSGQLPLIRGAAPAGIEARADWARCDCFCSLARTALLQRHALRRRVAAAGGLHGPDDAQVGPREVDVGRRAIAVGHLTTGSPRQAPGSRRTAALIGLETARSPRPQQRRRAIPLPGCGSEPFSPLLTVEGVAGAHGWCRRIGPARWGAGPSSEPDVPVSRHPAQASLGGWRGWWQWRCMRRGAAASELAVSQTTSIVLRVVASQCSHSRGFGGGLRRRVAWSCRSRSVRPVGGGATGRCG